MILKIAGELLGINGTTQRVKVLAYDKEHKKIVVRSCGNHKLIEINPKDISSIELEGLTLGVNIVNYIFEDNYQ